MLCDDKNIENFVDYLGKTDSTIDLLFTRFELFLKIIQNNI